MYHLYTFVCLWKNRSIYREVVCWRPRHYSYLSFLSFFLGTGWQSVEFSSTSSGALYTNIHMLIFMHFLVWWPKQDSRRERRGRKDISPDVLSAQGVHCWGKGHWLLKQTCEAEPVEGESASKTCDPQNLWAKFIPKKQKRKGTWSSPPEQTSVCAWRSAGPSPRLPCWAGCCLLWEQHLREKLIFTEAIQQVEPLRMRWEGRKPGNQGGLEPRREGWARLALLEQPATLASCGTMASRAWVFACSRDGHCGNLRRA